MRICSFPSACVCVFVHASVCMEICVCVCVFSRLEFSIIPKGQLQHSRCSFIPQREYWAIWNCSYHSYWTIALIAMRVWVHISVKGARGRRWKQCDAGPWETEQFTERLHAQRCVFMCPVFMYLRCDDYISIKDQITDIMSNGKCLPGISWRGKKSNNRNLTRQVLPVELK